MNVIRFAVELGKRGFKVRTDPGERGLQSLQRIPVKDFPAIMGNKDQMDVQLKNNVPTAPNIVLRCLRPIVRLLEWLRFFAIESNR